MSDSQVTYGVGLVAGTLVTGRLVDRYRRVSTQIYLMAGGLWFAALLNAATPALFAHIHSFLVTRNAIDGTVLQDSVGQREWEELRVKYFSYFHWIGRL